MTDFEYDDIYELESDLYSKNYKSPQQIQEHLYNVVYIVIGKNILNQSNGMVFG